MTTAILENARTALSALLARRPPDAQHDVVLFFSLSLKRARARTWTVSAAAFDEAWETGAALVERASAEAGEQDIWLRVDAVDEVRKLDWSAARARIAQSKRTYFRQGIVFGGDFASALLEQEINANGILFDPAKNEATPNAGALRDYSRERFGRTLQWPVEAQEPLWLFTTRAVFADSLATHEIVSAGRNSGYRNIEWSVEAVDAAIVSASAYLADQVQQDGRYRYGWLPIEDAVIPSYNALRHASSTYALLEAWEFTRDPAQEAAIRAALAHLAGQLIKQVTLPGGVEAAFLVDVGNEIKLGGNAVCLLAFVKYAQLTGDGRYAALLEKLALGVLHMQRPDGRFVHVLNFPDLTLKQEQRIIYYDGEAAFGLMRLYALTSDPRWLEAVVRAFDHFIEAEHWKAHDHWLSYCVNELTLFRPDARYFRFGLDNVRGYLDFVLERVTTFPTLLELMMAARLMIDRIRADDQHAHLLDGFDLEKFDRALEHRARYLLNGFFWPELAMFFRNPDSIVGSFFIRHHGFRVRIDDIEHYLSGYLAYRNYRSRAVQAARHPPSPPARARVRPFSDKPPRWTAEQLAAATRGTWLNKPPRAWAATGVSIYGPAMQPGNAVVVRADDKGKGMAMGSVAALASPPSAVIVSDAELQRRFDEYPSLLVGDTGHAILDIGSYARAKLRATVFAVTGSAGKTSLVAALAHVLGAYGPTGEGRHNANLPHGVSWNLASFGWDLRHVVQEIAIGNMALSSRIARPHVALFTNILPAHLGEHDTLTDIARAKARLFVGMAAGGVAILNRDMLEWSTVRDEAVARDLTVLNYGLSDDCDFQLLDYRAQDSRVIARIAGERVEYTLGAASAHMALNSLAVLAAISACDYPLAPGLDRLASIRALSGRGEAFEVTLNQARMTIIDHAYNANPGSMLAALEHLGAMGGRRVAILGEMAELGPNSRSYHTALAEAVNRLGIERVHAMGQLYDEFWANLSPQRRGLRLESVDGVKELLGSDLAAGDVVLVKGSHSTGMHKVVDWIKRAGSNVTILDA